MNKINIFLPLSYCNCVYVCMYLLIYVNVLIDTLLSGILFLLVFVVKWDILKLFLKRANIFCPKIISSESPNGSTTSKVENEPINGIVTNRIKDS